MRLLLFFLLTAGVRTDDLLVELDVDLPANALLPPSASVVAESLSALLLVRAELRLETAAWIPPLRPWRDDVILQGARVLLASVGEVSEVAAWWHAETVWRIATAFPWRGEGAVVDAQTPLFRRANATLSDDDVELQATPRPFADEGVCARVPLPNASFCVVVFGEGCECVPGYFWSEEDAVCQPCPAGTAKPGYGNASEDCVACDGGSTSSEGRAVCYPCPAGTYTADNYYCQPCDAYSESAEGAEACVCSAGATLDVSGSACAPCPHGTFSSAANASACSVCDPQLSTTTAYAGATHCDLCVPGAAGVDVCEACVEGTYAGGFNASVCLACAAGQYQPAQGATACLACTAGAYASGSGASACELCAAGFYQGQAAGASACAACAEGTVAGGRGASACDACTVGYQNLAAQTACLDCPHPHMASEGTRCTCDRGAVFDVSGERCGLCFAGFFKAAIGPGVCDLCPAYSQSLADGASACDTCVPGAVPVQGVCRPCRPGFFFFAADGACEACPTGTYTASWGATACEECGAGSYAHIAGAVACTPCPPFSDADPGSPRCACQSGWIMDAATQTCIPCPAGYVQLLGGGCVPCPLGTYAQGAGDGVFCTPCPVGTFSATIGALACSPCPPYMTTAQPGAAGCQCVYGAVLDWARGVCVPCPTGAYISADAGCTPCPAGTFSAVAGASDCAPCPPGTSASAAGATACARCDVWVTPDRTACHCPPGTFNDTTSGQCRACMPFCGAGTYETADCRFDADRACAPCTPQCAAGAYRIADCTPVQDLVCWPCRTQCLPGLFVSRACLPTSDILCQRCRMACPAGTYLQAACSPRADRVCAPCPPGTFHADGGDVAACLACPDGAYATGGASACTPCAHYVGPQRDACFIDGCPPGSYAVSTQACAACPPGSFSGDGGPCVVCVDGCVSPGRDACAPCAAPQCSSFSRVG